MCDCQDDYVVFIVIVVYYPDWHAYIEWSLGLWNEFNLLIVYDPLVYSLIWFANILLRIFATIFVKDVG